MQNRERQASGVYYYAIAIAACFVSGLTPASFAGEVEVRPFTPPDSPQRFGTAVAVSGDIIVVGAPGKSMEEKGRVYVYRRNGGFFDQVAELVNTESFAGDRFGLSVAMKSSMIVVSSKSPFSNEQLGSAFVFERPTEGWSGLIQPSAKLSTSDVDYSFGIAVDIDLQVANAVCGLPPRLRALVVVTSASAVYLYVEPPCGWEGELTENSKLLSSLHHDMGTTVAIDTDTIATGSPDPLTSTRVHVFKRPPLTGWLPTQSESATLVLNAGEFTPRGFGALDVGANGTRIAVSSTNSRRVFVYEEPDSGWSGEVEPVATLKRELEDEADLGESFGGSLSMDSDGEEIIVRGAARDFFAGLRGRVYKFKQPTNGWTGIVTESSIFGEFSPLFGSDPDSVSTDSGIAVAGSVLDGPVGRDGPLGAVFAYLDDEDSDGVPDVADNCPEIANGDQSDVDNDGLGDACDADADNDGFENNNDNAPLDFNPDQSDLDGDGVGDVADPCPSNFANTCDPDGSAASSIGTGGGMVATADGSVSITVPSGALSGETSISVTDTGDGFTLSSNSGEALAVFGAELGPEGIEFSSPISVVFAWDDADNDGVVDGTNLQEGSLVITKDGVEIAGECQVEPDCDPAVNTFLFSVSSFSEFTLAGPLDSDNDGVPNDYAGLFDSCPDTEIPEGAPSGKLGNNRWTLDGQNGFDFTQGPPQSGFVFQFTTEITGGCSCEQIVAITGAGKGHLRNGCSNSLMLDWINNP